MSVLPKDVYLMLLTLCCFHKIKILYMELFSIINTTFKKNGNLYSVLIVRCFRQISEPICSRPLLGHLLNWQEEVSSTHPSSQILSSRKLELGLIL